MIHTPWSVTLQAQRIAVYGELSVFWSLCISVINYYSLQSSILNQGWSASVDWNEQDIYKYPLAKPGWKLDQLRLDCLVLRATLSLPLCIRIPEKAHGYKLLLQEN